MAYSRDRDGKARQNFASLLESLRIDQEISTLAIASCSHGTNIAYVNNSQKGRHVITLTSPLVEKLHTFASDCPISGMDERNKEGVDALIASGTDIYLGVLAADCGVVALLEPKAKHIALVHAGGLGCFTGIIRETISFMKQTLGTNPANLYAYLYPCVKYPSMTLKDTGVWNLLKPFVAQEAGETFDLVPFMTSELVALGLSTSNIESSGFCTIGDNNLLFSNEVAKRNGTQVYEGRNLCLVGIRGN